MAGFDDEGGGGGDGCVGFEDEGDDLKIGFPLAWRGGAADVPSLAIVKLDKGVFR